MRNVQSAKICQEFRLLIEFTIVAARGTCIFKNCTVLIFSLFILCCLTEVYFIFTQRQKGGENRMKERQYN